MFECDWRGGHRAMRLANDASGVAQNQLDHVGTPERSGFDLRGPAFPNQGFARVPFGGLEWSGARAG